MYLSLCLSVCMYVLIRQFHPLINSRRHGFNIWGSAHLLKKPTHAHCAATADVSSRLWGAFTTAPFKRCVLLVIEPGTGQFSMQYEDCFLELNPSRYWFVIWVEMRWSRSRWCIWPHCSMHDSCCSLHLILSGPVSNLTPKTICFLLACLPGIRSDGWGKEETLLPEAFLQYHMFGKLDSWLQLAPHFFGDRDTMGYP